MQCPRVEKRIACTEGSCEYPYSEAVFHPDDLAPGEDPGHREPTEQEVLSHVQ